MEEHISVFMGSTPLQCVHSNLLIFHSWDLVVVGLPYTLAVYTITH